MSEASKGIRLRMGPSFMLGQLGWGSLNKRVASVPRPGGHCQRVFS
jgi:hypothetical protein